ncbi:hypothetical protein [Pseudomonas aeruginosa]|uniref:hypothetical protein n=1 Tax=Pseudomonas aeruginosa TaxID=287 RepID=UPI0012AFBF5B|nr:hypothetical protein [Pseudomonas aeruginosa]
MSELNKESVEQAGGDERAAFEAYRDRRNALLESEGHKPGSKWHVTNAHYPTWEASRAALAQPSPALPPFAEKVLAKLRRFYDCAEDFESGGVDIGRHWLDLLTQLGLLNRVQRSPAFWEISQQGEDLLGMPQPSPAQAEAERPEVVAYFDRNYPSTGDAFIWSNYEGSPYEPVMTVAQHDRIVGELRAEIAMLRSYEAEWELLLNEHEQQRDAALARVEQQERTIAGMNEAHAKLAGLYEAAQAQHSVPEASEQEKEQGWTLDYRFVERVTELAASRTEYTTSMEATEQVLLAARELLAAAPGKEVGHE